MEFLNSLKKRSKRYNSPFDHWELNEPLTEEAIKEICNSMINLGWNPYQNDHEDANGQFEMNWDYTDSLTTADRHVFFKFMVKTITEKHGLRATFMPKPYENLTGNS